MTVRGITVCPCLEIFGTLVAITTVVLVRIEKETLKRFTEEKDKGTRREGRKNTEKEQEQKNNTEIILKINESTKTERKKKKGFFTRN